MNQNNRAKPTLGAYVVGAYLFSVPAFAYSDSLGLLAVPQILGALLAAYALLDLLRGLRIDIPREIGLYGLLGLWAAISPFFGASSSEWETLYSLIKVAIATLACAQLIKDETDFFVAMKIFVFSILIVYYMNRYDLKYLRMAGEITEMDRFAGTLANANTAAIYSLTVFWACILLLLRAGKGIFKWGAYLLPMGISLLIVYYSGSKKGLIGLGLFVVFLARMLYFRQGSSSPQRGLVVFLSSSLIAAAGYFIYTNPFFFRMGQLVTASSDSDVNRMYLIKEAVDVWLTNWRTFFIGVGYDNFSRFSATGDYAHSTPFELLSSNGFIGFLLFMGFFLILFKKFVFLYRNIPDKENKSIHFMIVVFLSVFAFFMVAAVLHESRELLPILGSLAAFGQHQIGIFRRGRPGPDAHRKIEMRSPAFFSG